MKTYYRHDERGFGNEFTLGVAFTSAQAAAYVRAGFYRVRKTTVLSTLREEKERKDDGRLSGADFWIGDPRDFLGIPPRPDALEEFRRAVTKNDAEIIERLRGERSERGELHLAACVGLVAFGLLLQCLVFAVDYLVR